MGDCVSDMWVAVGCVGCEVRGGRSESVREVGGGGGGAGGGARGRGWEWGWWGGERWGGGEWWKRGREYIGPPPQNYGGGLLVAHPPFFFEKPDTATKSPPQNSGGGVQLYPHEYGKGEILCFSMDIFKNLPKNMRKCKYNA